MNHDRIMGSPWIPMYQYDRIMGYAMENNAIIPTAGSQGYTLLRALFDGEKLTVAAALEKYGVYALSQRMGELSRTGWPIQKQDVIVGSGKRVKQYWLDAQLAPR